MSDKDSSGKPTYGKALDTWASQRILNIIDLASIAIERAPPDTALAIDKINDAWEVMPNDIKDGFKSPKSEIFHALRQVPSYDSLIHDSNFGDESEIQTYRYQMAVNIVKAKISDYKDQFIRKLDDSGLYISQRKTKWAKRDFPALSGGNPESRTTSNE